MYLCKFCSKTFTSKSNLIYHQKTTKYCLQIQGKDVDCDEFICKFCSKSFTIKSSLTRHQNTCSVKENLENVENEKIHENLKNNYEEIIEENRKLKEEIEKYKEEIIIKNEKIKNLYLNQREKNQKIEKLENIIAKIAEKPRTTNNTVNNQRYNQIIQNLSPITQETLDELPSKLEDRHISQGPHGYVVFVQENLKDKLVCTDIARKKITFKDEKNNIITDINGKQITYKIFKSIRELREKLIEMKKSKAKTDLEKTQAIIYYGAEDAAIGKFLNMHEESVFSNKFISELSSKLYIKNIPLSKNSEIEELENLDLDYNEYLVLSDG